VAESTLGDVEDAIVGGGRDEFDTGRCDAERVRGVSVQLVSTITCPHCGMQSVEHMPTDACQWFYDCPACRAVIQPLPGDCCVFCSYGTTKCPPIQRGAACCG
jgi:hypothetical protein